MRKTGNFKLTKAARYKIYLEERKTLIDAWREGSKTFDKAILTFGSGAFAVSIAFLKDVTPTPFPNTLCLLGCSWLLFSASLILILFSFIASQNACENQIDIVFDELLQEKQRTNTWTIVTSIVNYASLVALALAFVLAGYFVYWNKIYTP